ncbi:MAG: lipoyl synthase [Oscillospiraceae bacterium]|nr:lipoyl synthase [Oscillospiraceae bacterium]
MSKKPYWLRVPYTSSSNIALTTELLEKLGLNTVCDEANCPNRAECFSNKTATFMILGKHCTRKCTFCNVTHGTPSTVDEHEPIRVANAIKMLELKHVVITSVTRDDLSDEGANQFANVTNNIRELTSDVTIELLIPDLSVTNIKTITNTIPNIIGHNIETVESLYRHVRPEAVYRRSLNVLSNIKQLNSEIFTKSGMMLGLGETHDEVLKTFDELLSVGCDFLTIGQYLSPSKIHYPVVEYITPDKFDNFANIARKKGFRYVASAPLVRSSYKAHEFANNS